MTEIEKLVALAAIRETASQMQQVEELILAGTCADDARRAQYQRIGQLQRAIDCLDRQMLSPSSEGGRG